MLNDIVKPIFERISLGINQQEIKDEVLASSYSENNFTVAYVEAGNMYAESQARQVSLVVEKLLSGISYTVIEKELTVQNFTADQILIIYQRAQKLLPEAIRKPEKIVKTISGIIIFILILLAFGFGGLMMIPSY